MRPRDPAIANSDILRCLRGARIDDGRGGRWSRQREGQMTMTISPTAASISERENQEIEDANASGNTPVVFIHGLWLLPSSWANWTDLFKEAGYAPLTPDWPDDPETVGGPGGPRRPRQEDLEAGRRSHRRDHRCPGQETSGHGALDRGPAGADARGPGPVGSHRGDRPGRLPGRSALAGLGAQGSGAVPGQPAHPRPRDHA